MKPSTSSQPTHCVQLLASRNFRDVEGINAALNELADYLTKRNYEDVLTVLLEHPLATELVLSCIRDSVPLKDWIMEDFPKAPGVYYTSFASKLFNHLSLFFVFHDQSLPVFTERFMDAIPQIHHLATTTPKLLTVLTSLPLEDTPKEEFYEEEEPMPHYFKVKAKKKRSKRGGKAQIVQLKIDLGILNEYDIPVPYSEEERAKSIAIVLEDSQRYLETLLKVLRWKPMAEYIEEAFVPTQEVIPDAQTCTQAEPEMVETAIEEKVPAAYPMVQPMKSWALAALHFNSAEGFGEWRILISSRADGDLREARRKDKKTFAIIVKKIKELSNGHFSADNQKRLNGPDTDVPIFEAKMSRDKRLVYQVDSISDYDSTVERQVLRIFGVYTHAQFDDRLWQSIGRQLASRGKEYRRRCTHRELPINRGDNVFLPAVFPPLEVETPTTPVGLDLPPDDLEQIHSLLVLEKYLTFSRELLHSALLSQFKWSRDSQNPSGILADLDVSFPFQVSPQEKVIIEHPHSCYVLGRSGTGKTTTMLLKMLRIERTFQMNSEDMAKPRQIFVTKSRVLAGKVEEYFLKLLESLKSASQSPEELRKQVVTKRSQTDEDGLVDLDDEDSWRNDLPRKYSELQDSHFPLFLTFDRLCDLIEADFDHSEHLFIQRENDAPSAFVSFEVFENHYWPHFPQPLIKGLDPALVFSEIIGIIKGSEKTIVSGHGHLDRKTYEELSERTNSTFATNRSILYSIFEVYQTRKRQRGEYDAADRTHRILRMFQTPERGVKGQKVDQLCVDEAQDNLLIDALLLRSLSRNPNGLFWAGDTAQTISVGSSFRFDDLKAFLFRVEKRREEKRFRISDRPQQSPETFQLATNYRSHAGIVNCAQSVIELITRFWPYSIDTLAPEKGIVEGLKPVFLNGWDEDNVRYEQFLFGSSGSHIEFGAQQCILVRNDSARRRLQEQVGDIGLIMTLYESKGLEFNDVLLFNFFDDSIVELSQWRLLLTAASCEDHPTTTAPQFDRVRHASICAELKFLYVAITRARKNLWLADQSQKGEPMRVFWTARNQIHNCTPGSDMPRLAVSSTPEEWAGKGKELFERKKYLQAKHCYERASMPREMAIANAYYLRVEAQKAPAGDTRYIKERRNQGFVMAAEAFVACAKEARKNRIIYFRRAAECFTSGAEELQAAKTYVEAQEYDIAAKLFRKLGHFDEAVDVIKENEHRMQSEVVENIRDVARLYYFREARLEKARELFSTDEEELEYLEDLDLDVARAEVLVSLGRSAEAAMLHLSEGRIPEAIPLFLQDSRNTNSMQQACLCILRGFWEKMSFGITSNEHQVSQLIDWSNSINAGLVNDNNYSEISMFKAIIAYDRPTLARLARTFIGIGNSSAATLSLYHLFKTFPRVTGTIPSEELANTLELFIVYIRLLYELAFQHDPRTSPWVWSLFGFQYISLDKFFLPPHTFLALNAGGQQPLAEGIFVTGLDLHRILARALRNELRHRISEQILHCRHAAQFSPCLTYVACGFCYRVQCPQEHLSAFSLSTNWYNTRIRLNLQQILVLQTSYSMGDVTLEEMRRQKREYLSRFYEAVNPPFYYLGSPTMLKPELIPEYQRGLHVLRDWFRHIAYELDIFPWDHFLTNLLRLSLLSLTFDQRNAPAYLRQAPCLFRPLPSGLYSRTSGRDSLIYNLLVGLEGGVDTSIASGVVALDYIVEAKLPININDICNLLEYLCGTCVISFTLHFKSSCHGITLPRSWLLRQLSYLESGQVKSTRPWMYDMIIRNVAAILETIHQGVGAGHLLYDTSNLLNIPSVRQVFIARICRAACLLGYNINMSRLRTAIHKAVTSIANSDNRNPGLYRQYVSARSWSGLVSALRNMTQGSLVDELVQLHDLGKAPLPERPANGVHIVPFKNSFGLLQSLGASHQPLSPLESSDGGSAPLNEQESAMQVVDSNEVNSTLDTDVPEAVEDVEEGHEVAWSSDMHAEEPVPEMTSADIPEAHPPSEDEKRAALTIMKAYRYMNLQRRQSAKAGSTLQGLKKLFSDCLSRSYELSWEGNLNYRLLFLGPLPHLLLCLDVAIATTSTEKKQAKKQLSEETHEQLERVGERLNVLVKLSKSLISLQKSLEPSSNMHSRADRIEWLRRTVREATELLHSLPFTTTDHFRGDLAIAVKGIVTARSPPKPRSKPELVLDEDEEGHHLT